MFEDKLLRNTFYRQLIVIVLPTSVFVLADVLNSRYIGITSLILGIIGLFVSIDVLRQFIRSWKIWNPRSVKITGIALAVLGILLGLYAILGLFAVLTYVGGGMIG